MSAPEKIRLDALHPYPGPSSFDEDHAAFFCGREREAEDLFALVEMRPLTVVYGKSGLGKTSLLQAGLFPRMRQVGLVPIRIKLLFGVDEHGARQPPLADQVRQRIREAIDRDELDGAPPRDDETLWEYFHWTGFWDAGGTPVKAVLVLDQFEEVFTLGHERKRELSLLMRELADLVENRIPLSLREAGAALPPSYDAASAKALIALREEFVAQLDDYRPQMPSLAAGRYRLRPLDGVEAKRAVLDPGREVVTDDIAGRIVKRLANAPDDARLEDIEEVEPALLALYCHELNALRDKAKLPKIDVALLTGNEKDILEKFYERCMTGMPKEVHVLVEERLLTPDDRRDTVAFGRAIDLGVDPKDLTALVDRRLLRKVPLLGHEYVQIVHDKLVPTIAKRRDARQRRDETEKATKIRTRRLGTAGLAILAVATMVTFAWRWMRSAEALKIEKVAAAQVTIANAEARAVELAQLGWRTAGDQRWDDIARVLGAAYGSLAKARETRAKFPRQIGGTSDSSAELSLLATRFEANAGRMEAMLGDRGAIEVFVLSKEGTRGAMLGTDKRKITLVDMASRRVWAADPPGISRAIQDEGALIEATDAFAGPVRGLLASGDGSTLFGIGDNGQVAVWRVADGTRVSGFRARLARPSIEVDRSGSRVLVRDLDADRAVVVTLDPSPGRGLTSVELSVARPTSERVGPRRLDRTSDWQDFTLSADGRRVIGLCVESSWRGGGGARSTTEIALWEVPGPAPVVRKRIDGRIESASVSENGGLLAVRTDRELHVFSLDDHKITSKGPSRTLSTDAWFGFHDPFAALLIASAKTLSLIDFTGEPRIRFDFPIAAGVRRATLSRDASQALVAFEDEVRLYDTKLGQPRASVQIPDAERRSVELRIPGGAIVVTSKSDAIRVRALGGVDARPIDRFLWGESSDAKALYSSSIPRGGVVEDVDGDGDRIAVLADGAVSLVRASPSLPERLDITPLVGREVAIGKALVASAAAPDQSVRAISVRAGHVASFDASGSLRRSVAPFSTQRRASIDAGPGSLLAIARDGAWIVTGGRGPVRVWGADKSAPEWSADLRYADSKSKQQGPDVVVTALAITSDSDAPRAIVGDEGGDVRAIRSVGEKGNEWIAEAFRPRAHAAGVRAIEIAADGRIATAADDGTVALWNKDGSLLRSIAILPPAPARVLRFADEGRLLLVASRDSVRVWKTADGVFQCGVPHTDAVREIAIDGDGASARAASVDAGGTAIVWSIATCSVLRTARGIAYAGFLSAARDRVVTVRRTGRVELWTASDATSEDLRDRPRGASTWGAFLRGGTLLTGDEENGVFAWKQDASSAAPTRVAGEIGGVVTAASAGDRVVTATADGRLRVWSGDVMDAGIAAQIPLEGGLAVRAAAVDTAGRHVFTIEDGPDDSLRARLSPMPMPKSFSPGKPTVLTREGGCAGPSSRASSRFVAAINTGETLRALVVEAAGCVHVWDADGKLRVEESGKEASETLSRISAAAIDQRFEHVVLGGADGTISTWAIETSADKPIARLHRIAVESRRHTGRVRAIAFHPEGRFFVTASDDGQALLWDAKDGRMLTHLGAHPAAITWIAFRPDGSEIVTGGAGGFLRAFATHTHTRDPDRVRRAIEAWLPELAKPAP